MTVTASASSVRAARLRQGGNPWILAARPKTLPAAVVPVCLGSALAFVDGGFLWFPALICLSFALLIQIGTNFANDYFDFVKGADTEARIGPTRAVAAGLVTPKQMRRATAGVFGLAILIGALLLPYGGWWLLVVGLLSVLCGIAYTGGPYPLGYNGWGDFFVFVFFGLVATGFTYFVQTGAWSATAWILGCVPGALSANILMVNNLRDVETDRLAGKRTLVVRWGIAYGEYQYLAMWGLAYVVTLYLAWVLGSLWILLPWLLFAWVLQVSVTLRRSQGRGAGRWGYLLATTAKLMLLFGALLTAGLILAAVF